MNTATVELKRLKPHPSKPRFSHGEVLALFDLPFNDLLFSAQTVHREHFDPNAVQLSTLLSIKTGGCPEDCGYCPQAARYHTGVENEAMLPLDEVVAAAQAAKDNGATRFCMGAAWRGPKQNDLEPVLEMVKAVRGARHGNLRHAGHVARRASRATERRRAGLLQPQPRHRAGILRRNHHARANTTTAWTRWNACATPVCMSAAAASSAWAKRARARAGLIAQLANLDPQPESVPINNLVQVEGTPLHGTEQLDPLEFVRTIAVARITMPKSSCVCRQAGGNWRSDAGFVFSGRRQFDFLRRQIADHWQSRCGARSGVVCEIGVTSSVALTPFLRRNGHKH